MSLQNRPPPVSGVDWKPWGERLVDYLSRIQTKLMQRTYRETASDDGLLMWDRSIEHPVVSLDGEWVPLAYGANEPDQGYGYGLFFNTTTHTQAAVDTPDAIELDYTAYSKNVAIDGTYASRIVFSQAGKYMVNFTAQLNSQSASAKTFWFWPRINGTDIPGSTMRITLHDNDEAKTVARGGIFEVSAGDYLEAMWAVDDLNTSLKSYAAETFCPAVPSVTLLVKNV
jgi:hypothetical protein